MEKTFDEKLKERYPELFYVKEDGSLYVPCGIYCPTGWETLVDALCAKIARRVNHPDTVQTRKWLYKLHMFAFKRLLLPVTNNIQRFIDPAEALHWKDGKRNQFLMISVEQSNRLKKRFPVRSWIVKKIRKGVSKVQPLMRFKKGKAPEFKIDQIKEKFGTLRFYYTGGDASIGAYVGFAEYLTNSICSNTGQYGKLVSKNGFYQVLSESEATRLGFS